MGFWQTFCDTVAHAMERARDTALNDLKPLAGALGFNSETLYSYSISVERVIKDEDIPAITCFQGEILNAILNDNPIPYAVKLASVAGPAGLVNGYQTYGENAYYFGIPEVGFKSPPIHIDEFLSIVSAFLTNKSYTAVADESYNPVSLVEPTAYDWGLAYLQKEYNYKSSMVIGGNSYVYEGATVAAGNCKATLVRFVSSTSPVYEYIGLPDITTTSLQLHYRWKCGVEDGDGNTFMFTYLFPYDYAGQSGEYPEMVESPEGDYDNPDSSKHLPVVPLKRRSVYTTSGDAPEYYTSCRNLMRKLNLDLDDIVDTLSDSEDMDNVTDAYFVMGVNPHDESSAISEYLYMYFYVIYYAMGQGSYENFNSDLYNAYIHLIKVEEDTYNISLFFYYIKKTLVEGVIGSIGTFTKEVQLVSQVYNNAENGVPVAPYVRNNLILKRQTTSTHYEVLTVHGLRSLCTLTAADGAQKGQIVDLDDTTKFIIPLNYLIGSIRNKNEYEQLVYKSMHLVLFASTYEDLEWFESSSFMQFFEFAMMAISLYFFLVSGVNWSQFLVKAMTAWAVRELFITILENNVLTNEQVAVLVIAYAAYSAYSGGGFSSEAGLADTILLSISAVSEGVTFYTGIETQKLKDQYEEDLAEYKEYEEYLKELQDGMDNTSDLDAYYLQERNPVKTETGDRFIARSLTTNTTRVCTNYCEFYADSELDLGSVGLNAA